MATKNIFNRNHVLYLTGLALIIISIAFLPTSTVPASGNINVTASTTGNVTFTVTDSSITFGNLDLATWPDTATIGGETRKIWDSETNASTSPDSAAFNEGNTNVNASWYLTVVGQTVAGKDSTSWLYLKDTTNTFDPDGSTTTFGSYGTYWLPSFSGTLGTSTTGFTAPSGKTIDFTASISVTMLASSDGNNWDELSTTLYVIVTTDDLVYIDDDMNFSDTTEGGVLSEVGPLSAQYAQATLFGNPWILMDNITALTSGNTITFRFGWQKNYDGLAGNQSMEFYVLLAIPVNAPATTWTWTITINGVQYNG